jgi:hypothetical protein
MTVHVDEVHSDVAPVPSAPGDQPGTHRPPPWEAEERWREDQDRAAWVARRVCAVDFDD